MSELEFEVETWLGGAAGGAPLEEETLASLRILVGPNRVPVTEVEDTIAQTLRSHINVSTYSIARWLVVNWWRLRWEPFRGPSYRWLSSHSMAAIGDGYAWPAVTFSSDGEFVRVRMRSESTSDVAAVRYLRDVTIDVSADSFERAVEGFLDQVEARVALRVAGERQLSALRQELREEQTTPLAIDCKRQALAGMDPGSATKAWLRAVGDLSRAIGNDAGEEVLAVVPTLQGGINEAKSTITAMRQSSAKVNLDWATVEAVSALPGELPWERGVRLARALRQQVSLGSGPLGTAALEELIAANLPLNVNWKKNRHLSGGYRNGVSNGRAGLLVTSPRIDGQRFYLARLIGATLVSDQDQHVLPVSDAVTAFQKFERSFAQEFLCPWTELEAFTDEHGTDDEAIAEAAEHFIVSELLILTTLVNKGKLSRDRLYA